MRKGVAVIGSTGSIGTQALRVLEEHSDRFAVRALACRRGAATMARQAERFAVRAVALAEPEERAHLTGNYAVLTGDRAACELVEREDVEIVILAVVGAAAIPVALAALKAGKRLALANKECLVAAGHLIMNQAEAGQLIPVDSEHSALFQALQGERRTEVSRLLLTASGGPFREVGLAQLRQMGASQALQHPTWSMGQKITIDSATLMNKGLEVIEAHWLYDQPYERIEVLVHPQSIVHSLVEFRDGAQMAQLGLADMRLPILYALSYPERLPLSGPRLDLAEVGRLTFAQPDLERFPALGLAYEAGNTGGSAPAVLNAANEVAVERFLRGEIGFMDIPALVGAALAAHTPITAPALEDVLAADLWARHFVAEYAPKA